MRTLRSVTLVPIARFSRILNCAMALRDFVITGFWPAIFSSSEAATLTSFESVVASPTPMFRTILVIFGTCMALS